MAKTGLGRGLDLLIPKEKTEKSSVSPVLEKELEKKEETKKAAPAAVETEAAEAVPATEETEAAEPEIMPISISEEDDAEKIVMMRISKIEPNKDQSRKTFDEDALNELSESIKQYGIIQPIVVCKKDGYYEIIAGERRFRASKKAGLKEVPVIIRNYEEKEKAEVSLIENIQRENLNPIEEAAAYKQLIDDYSLTQENLAARLSKSRTAIANTMRLLKLPKEVQQMVVDGKISGGHARALVTIETEEAQIKAAKRIVEGNLNVRQAEDLAKSINKPKKEKSVSKKKEQQAAAFKEVENRMEEVFGTKVKINHKPKGNGTIEISYYSETELDRLYMLINGMEI